MTSPTDEEDVIVELRLQPVVARPDGWRGRSSGLIAAGLVAFIVVGIALGTTFGTGRPASSAAAVVPEPSPLFAPSTRRPTPTPRPQMPPLPVVEIVGGHIPTERRLVYANGLQILDLATGELTTQARPWEDLLLQIGDSEVVCVCMTRQDPVGDPVASTVVLRLERTDTTGRVAFEREVTTFEGVVAVPEMDLGFTMAAKLSADDRSVFVITATRRPPIWAVELHHVDASSGELISSMVIDELAIDVEEPEPSPSTPPATPKPDGSPPDGLHVWANALAISPDGATLAATVGYSIIRGDAWTSGFHEFLVPIADGRPGTATELASAEIGNGWCVAPPEFVDHAELVQVCTSPDGPFGPDRFYVRRVSTGGDPSDDVALRDTPWSGRYQLSIAVDRARRGVLSWDPVEHSLARVSLDDGTIIASEVARAMLPEPRSSDQGGYFGAEPGLVLSPDGQRVYAVGVALGPSDSGTPTGVWAFDAETLELVDHWQPRAMLSSLAVSADGQFVYAAGASGFDVEGNQAPNWPSSVTVYDALTGEVQVVYGAVSRDSWVNFRPVP